MHISFDHHIEAPLAADRLWELLTDAFRDSRTNPIWPREYETLRSDGLEAGATVEHILETLLLTQLGISQSLPPSALTARDEPRHCK